MRKATRMLAMVLLAIGIVGCSKSADKSMSCCADAKKEGHTCTMCAPAFKGIKLSKPELLFPPFGNTINVPDGMALGPDNCIYLSVPNLIDCKSAPDLAGKIMKITFADDGSRKMELCSVVPVHPESGTAHPMGLDFGPDGNLYVAENQYFGEKELPDFKCKEYKSRVMRLNFKDGKPTTWDVVVTGTKLSNAIRFKGNDMYVSDTFFDIPGKKHQSGIHRISIDEMNKGTVNLDLKGKDGVVNGPGSHLVAQFTAKGAPDAESETAGADGMAFDKRGNLYCGNFGDGVISKMTFDKDGKCSQEIVVDDPSFTCCDGIYYDAKRDVIWLTNSKLNSIHALDTKDNSIANVWENDDNDGSTGLLDQPCEPIVRGDKLVVVNFDFGDPAWGLKNQGPDDIKTLSIFDIIQ